ncbi:FtsX-like permease family protein [Pseudoalteromonas denitrificans]|uniref:Putative ABC transport system permease protein n=1 Tax=Pseudoalteromonas denitrificans DSM 6059 TaxID=1123010 RepID=A0A1I1G2D9_9GAMM|nr:FtsX-like permease family protein [Pseudoalteromonas denitrificans]SFC05917.1 putative ABC transport system permease protein [Pseudoalteromonas denitrificans DSM 6059]
MNIKALLKALKLRKFATTLLLLQLALTLGLVVNTVLLSLDASKKLNNPLRFDVDNLVVAQLLPTSGDYRETDYYHAITKKDLKKLTELDGVISVAQYNQLPIQNGGWNGNFKDDNTPDDVILDKDLDTVPIFYSSHIGLSNLGVDIVQGRALTKDDDMTQDYYAGKRDEIEPNIVITESLAKAVYPDESALGKLSNHGRIVGIAKDFMVNPRWQGRSKYFAVFGNFMFAQADFTQSYVLHVMPGQVKNIIEKVEETILAVQPERDIINIYSMKDRHNRFFSQESGLAKLFTTLCILMILVTIVSSFAHAHFHISQQRKYIGIRRALGATKKDIMIYVFSENWLMSIFACILGIGSTIAINILLSQVITIEKPDIELYFMAVAVIFVSGTIATWLPAYKTTKISPVIATHTL